MVGGDSSIILQWKDSRSQRTLNFVWSNVWNLTKTRNVIPLQNAILLSFILFPAQQIKQHLTFSFPTVTLMLLMEFSASFKWKLLLWAKSSTLCRAPSSSSRQWRCFSSVAWRIISITLSSPHHIRGARRQSAADLTKSRQHIAFTHSLFSV